MYQIILITVLIFEASSGFAKSLENQAEESYPSVVKYPLRFYWFRPDLKNCNASGCTFSGKFLIPHYEEGKNFDFMDDFRLITEFRIKRKLNRWHMIFSYEFVKNDWKSLEIYKKKFFKPVKMSYMSDYLQKQTEQVEFM